MVVGITSNEGPGVSTVDRPRHRVVPCKGRPKTTCKDAWRQEAVPDVVPDAGPGVGEFGRSRCRA